MARLLIYIIGHIFFGRLSTLLFASGQYGYELFFFWAITTIFAVALFFISLHVLLELASDVIKKTRRGGVMDIDLLAHKKGFIIINEENNRGLCLLQLNSVTHKEFCSDTKMSAENKIIKYLKTQRDKKGE